LSGGRPARIAMSRRSATGAANGRTARRNFLIGSGGFGDPVPTLSPGFGAAGTGFLTTRKNTDESFSFNTVKRCGRWPSFWGDMIRAMIREIVLPDNSAPV